MSLRRPLAPGTDGHPTQIVAPDTIDPSILASGTPTGSKFLRDDGTFALPGSSGASLSVNGIYGDGSDSNVSISTTVTLTKDMYYDTLTVTGTGVLKTANFRVNCKTACNVNASGVISNNGNNAAGAVAGTAGAAGTLPTNPAGAAGGIGVGGSSSGSPSNALGGKGGTGGTGGAAGSNAGGTAGTAFGPTASTGQAVRQLPQAALGLSIGAGATLGLSPGTGGSGAGGDASASGGGGGASGGVLIINAPSVNNQGSIQANGGAGANGVAGITGGGGGGGGGVVVINSSSALVGNAPTATGGAGGTKTGVGSNTNGSNGSNGSVLQNVWS